MTVRFKGTELRPVLAEAAANQCRVILVKDQGVYFMAEHGESRPDGRRKTIAYAVGCNPDVDAFDDWWELARAEFGARQFPPVVERIDIGVAAHGVGDGLAPPIGPALAVLGHEIHALVLDQDDAALVGRRLGKHGPKLGAFESNSHGSGLQR